MQTISDFFHWSAPNIDNINVEEIDSIYEDFIKSNEHIVERIKNVTLRNLLLFIANKKYLLYLSNRFQWGLWTISWFFSISWLLVIITNREVKEGEEKIHKSNKKFRLVYSFIIQQKIP